jgi:intein-encoded DNA endonuclease-like protein
MSEEETIAYLNGALHDASLNKGKRIRFVQKDVRWLHILQSLLKDIGSNSWIYKEGKMRDLHVLETLCSKLDFKHDPLSLKSRRAQSAYVRGFFDAEGGVPRTADRFYVQLVQKNYKKIAALKEILDDLGITSGKIHNPSKRIDPEYWRIFVSARSWKLFADRIGSFHPIKAQILKDRMKI